jgi:hypothetical protein
VRIEHPHFAGADALDFVRTVAELKDVAGETLNRKVFIECAYKSLGGFEYDSIISRVGDRTALVIDINRAPRRPRIRPLTAS